MPYVLIRHKVADYQKWRRAFDAHGRVRKSGGTGSRSLMSLAGAASRSYLSGDVS